MIYLLQTENILAHEYVHYVKQQQFNNNDL